MKRETDRFGKKFNEMEKTECEQCGAPVYVWKVLKGKTYKCKSCRYLEKESLREKKRPLNELEADRRLEIAQEYLQQKRILDQYSKPIDILKEHLYKPNYFQSSNEVLTALELLRTGYQFKHQVKISVWRADFVISSLKVILEIDGILYHTKDKKEKEQFRDSVIVASMGPEWEVIRIKEDVLRKNIQKLIPAIKKIKAQREKVRKSYNQLPKWYSDTHK